MQRSGQFNGRANKAGKVEGKILSKHTFVILVCFIFSRSFAADQIQFKQPATLKELLALSPADLEKCDLAWMNLLCAEGLSGAGNLNVDDTLATLDL